MHGEGPALALGSAHPFPGGTRPQETQISRCPTESPPPNPSPVRMRFVRRQVDTQCESRPTHFTRIKPPFRQQDPVETCGNRVRGLYSPPHAALEFLEFLHGANDPRLFGFRQPIVERQP